MGIVPDDEEDGLTSGRLEVEDTQDQAFTMFLTTLRSVTTWQQLRVNSYVFPKPVSILF